MRTRKLVALALTALLGAGGAGYGAGSRTRAAAIGFVNARGEVRIDNVPALPATAVFPGDRVATGADAAAVLKLSWGASVILGSNGLLALPKEAGSQRIDFTRGVAIIRSQGTAPTVVRVPGAEVAVGGGEFPTLCRIAMLGAQAGIFADQGRVEVRDGGRSALIPTGRWVHLGAGAQAGAAGQRAGSVTAEIPRVVRHPSQTPKNEVPLELNAEVDWQDIVQTIQSGRVRITMLDGTVLNIGANSHMQIVEHNPQAQQTTVELTLGKMRAEVKKLTQPNAHFEVKTQTAVIGVVGTIFIVQALHNATRVWSIEGQVTVQNINPAVQGKVTLQPGESTSVAAGLAPAAPVEAPAAQMGTEISQTNVASVPGAEVAPGVTETPMPSTTAAGVNAVTGPGVSSASNLAMSGAEAGAAGAAATMGGIAISRANDATSAANQAATNAQAA
jgi:ferric-dicitrate binding protein FerR (iron transport regulator)